MSPDGMYYWDGVRWLSTLSPDGRYRWNGTSWTPAITQGYVPPAAASGPSRREPTSWTRPMQYAVAGWYALSALYGVLVPFLLSGTLSQIVNASMQRQEQLNPEVSPLPAQDLQLMTTMVQWTVWISVALGIVICLVLIAGALRRWRWAFYAVLVFLGLGALAGPLNLIEIFAGPAYARAMGYSFPTELYVIGLIAWVPATALFVWMLVAAIKRGPWAMRKVT